MLTVAAARVRWGARHPLSRRSCRWGSVGQSRPGCSRVAGAHLGADPRATRRDPVGRALGRPRRGRPDRPRQRRRHHRGRDPDHAAAHAGTHPWQPVLPRRRAPGGGRHAVPQRLRSARPSSRSLHRWKPNCPTRVSDDAPRAAATTSHAAPRLATRVIGCTTTVPEQRWRTAPTTHAGSSKPVSFLSTSAPQRLSRRNHVPKSRG